MKIFKPMLIILTPIGVVWGLIEGYRLAGGLVFLMFAFFGLLVAAFAQVVITIRRESREKHRDQ